MVVYNNNQAYILAKSHISSVLAAYVLAPKGLPSMPSILL